MLQSRAMTFLGGFVTVAAIGSLIPFHYTQLGMYKPVMDCATVSC
jgi:hypothetical protein